MRSRLLIIALVGGVLTAAIFVWYEYRAQASRQGAQSTANPAVTVTSAKAEAAVWHPVLQAVASLRAVQGTDVSAQLAGIVSEIHFKSGQRVREGDLMVQLDVSVEQARLQGLAAEVELARVHLSRIRELSKTQDVSDADLDQAEAEFKQARAAVTSQQELIERKTIRAPFTGMVGIRRVSLGDYLAPGARIVTLQSLDPIFADFSLPQQEFDRVSEGQSVVLRLDTYPDTEFSGTITAINPKITETTRNFRIRATFDNSDHRLRPGMFGEVQVELPDRLEVTTLPRTAISYNPYGDYVFVIKQAGSDKGGDGLVVRRTFVQTGQQRGTQIAIGKGVEAGQRVVTSGQLKLREGSRVRIDNTVTPTDTASFTPPDES